MARRKRVERETGGSTEAAVRLEPRPSTLPGVGLWDRWSFGIAIALTAAILGVYLQVRHHEYLRLDDNEYITANPNVARGLSAGTVAWAMTSFEAANWHPLTWLSYLADISIFGMKAGPQLLVNVAIHTLNSLILYLLLFRLTGLRGRSAVVAGLFALHPLHVESVAWVSERKDVLSTFFWLLTMWSYAEWTAAFRRSLYVLMLVLFALGLMAKPMLVTLPFVLLLLDVWPLGRIAPKNVLRPVAWWPLFREKLPLFLLTVASSVVTFEAQRGMGAVLSAERLSAGTKLTNALISYLAYLGKTIWPANLAVYYPYRFEAPEWQALLAAAFLAAVTVVAVRRRDLSPWLFFGWFWFLGTLVPVIGLVQVGEQAMADRYTYVPLTGVFIIVVWVASETVDRYRVPRALAGGLAVSVLAALSLLSFRQTALWKDGVTLFTHTLKVTSDNYFAHCSLGVALELEARKDEAAFHYRESLRINPNYNLARNNLADLRLGMGDAAEAVTLSRRALEIEPASVTALTTLGRALLKTGNPEEAVVRLGRAVQLNPASIVAREALGTALLRTGRVDQAKAEFTEVLRRDPKSLVAKGGLARGLSMRGQGDQAIKDLTALLQENQKSLDLRNNLASALAEAGRTDEAIEQLRAVLQQDPKFHLSRQNLGALLASKQRFSEAAAEFARVVEAEPGNVEARIYLVRALAAAGRTAEAVAALKEALPAAPEHPVLKQLDAALNPVTGNVATSPLSTR